MTIHLDFCSDERLLDISASPLPWLLYPGHSSHGFLSCLKQGSHWIILILTNLQWLPTVHGIQPTVSMWHVSISGLGLQLNCAGFSFIILCVTATVFPGGTSAEEPTCQFRRHQETWVRSLGWEDPLEEEMATHSSALAWRSHGEGSLGGYSPWGHRVGRDWSNLACITSISSYMQPLASKYLLAFNILPSPSFKIYAPFKALLHATASLESFLLWRFPIGRVFCHLWPSLYISSEDLLWRRALVYFLEQSYALWSLSSMEDLLGWVACRIHFNKHNAKIWNQTPGSALPHPPHSGLPEFLMKGAWGILENEAGDEWQGPAGGYSHAAGRQADPWGQGNG